MKKLLFLFLAVFMAMLPPLGVLAYESGETIEIPELRLSIEIPKRWTALTRNNLDEFADMLYANNTSPADMKKKLLETSTYLTTYETDKVDCEITVTAVETAVSADVFNLARIDQAYIAKMIKEVMNTGDFQTFVYENYALINHQNIFYIQYDISRIIDGKSFATCQYYTIVNGKAISFSIHSTSAQLTAAQREAITDFVRKATFTELLEPPADFVGDSKSFNWRGLWLHLGVVIGVIAIVTLISVLIRSLSRRY